MPNYDYRCSACGHTCEIFQKMSDKPVEVCPQCQGGPFKRIITSVGIIFKGSGFHINDYKGASGSGASTSAPAETSAPAPAAAETKSEGAPSGSTGGDGDSSGKAVA